MALEVRPLTPTVGAEISGADLVDLSGDQFDEIRRALIEHLVIFFRDQPQLTPAQQIAFAERFGIPTVGGPRST